MNRKLKYAFEKPNVKKQGESFRFPRTKTSNL